MYARQIAKATATFSKEGRNAILSAAHRMANLKPGAKVMICGNGGDAALSNHFATDLMKFGKVPAISLAANQSMLTMIANDYGYERVFAWQVYRLKHDGDILVCLSTSGKSANVIQAAFTAKAEGVQVLSVVGERGAKEALSTLSDLLIVVPELSSPMQIEDVQGIVLHMIAAEIALLKEGL